MTSTWENDALTCDAFLGGALRVWQPRAGYRAGVDPVFLAAATDARPGQSVLDLGCGVGVAGLCLQRRVGGLALAGLELHPGYADLARRNAKLNGVDFDVATGDVQAMPAALRARSFDHVIANPPYFPPGAGTNAEDAGRDGGRHEAAPLDAWVDAATRRLAPRGWLTMIQRADRLPDLLRACDDRLGDIRILPLAPRQGRVAELVILRARKGARGPFRLLPPLVLHDGDAHDADRESYRPHIHAILRDGNHLKID